MFSSKGQRQCSALLPEAKKACDLAGSFPATERAWTAEQKDSKGKHDLVVAAVSRRSSIDHTPVTGPCPANSVRLIFQFADTTATSGALKSGTWKPHHCLESTSCSNLHARNSPERAYILRGNLDTQSPIILCDCHRSLNRLHPPYPAMQDDTQVHASKQWVISPYQPPTASET